MTMKMDSKKDFAPDMHKRLKTSIIICNCGGNGMHQMGELMKVTPDEVVLKTGPNTSTIIYRSDITVIEWIE